MHLYILKLKNNKWYVGTTSKTVEERFQEHLTGNGSQWTRLYPPLAIEDFRPISALQSHLALERKETYKLMFLHGVNNVRGGPRIQVEDFSDMQLNDLVTEIGHDLDMKFTDVRNRLGLPPFKSESIDSKSPTASNAPSASVTVASQMPPSSFLHQPPPAVAMSPAIPPSASTYFKRSWDRFQAKPRGDTKRAKQQQKRYVEEYSICVSCGDEKTPDQEKPLCRDCWKQVDSEDAFDVCAICGKGKEYDSERPLCYKCYSVWKKEKGVVQLV